MECFNFEFDVGESDIDCGGSLCWQRCELGMRCVIDSDCFSNTCINNICNSEEGYVRILSGSGAAATRAPVTEEEYSDLSVSLVFFAVCIGIIVLAARYIEVSVMQARERAHLIDSIQPLIEMKKKNDDEHKTENLFA